jgi:DUF1009 family protein
VFKNPAGIGSIGLIAGQGEFPILFAEAALSLKFPVVLFGLEGYTDKRVEALTSEAHYVGLGELGRLVDLLKQSKIKRVVFAGSVPKKQIYNPGFKLDSTAQSFIQNTRNKGDDHILRAFGLFLKAHCGISVIDSRSILKESLAPKGVLTRRVPTSGEWQDLRFGWKIAKGIGKMDIGQTVVVKEGVVLAVEAIEGTDQAVRRAGDLGHGGGVVVKVSKPNQDLRFDLPCVGLETLQTLREVSSRVLGIEARKTILISSEKLIETANRHEISLVGL